MDSYYLKLRGFLKPSVLRLGVSEKRWREQVWGDLGDGTTGFDYHHPVGDELGRSLELFGKRFVLVTEPDRKRADTLFVGRIYPRWQPDLGLLHTTAALALLPGPNAKVRSPVALLFAPQSAAAVRALARFPQAAWTGGLEVLEDDALKLALSKHSGDLGDLCDGGELEAAVWDELGRILGPRSAFADVLDGVLATDRPLRAVVDWASCLRPGASAPPPPPAPGQRVSEVVSVEAPASEVVVVEPEVQPNGLVAVGQGHSTAGKDLRGAVLATLSAEPSRSVRANAAAESGAVAEPSAAIQSSAAEPKSARTYLLRSPVVESRLPQLWAATSPAREVIKAAPQRLWVRARRGIAAARLQPPALVSWPEGIHPEYVARHPLGVQRQAQAIVDRLRIGKSSLAVVSPRRSGRSTLAAHLARLDQFPDLALGALVECADLDTSHRDVGAAFLAKLAESLEVRFGPQPAKVAELRELVALFDSARAIVGRAGAKCLVVIVDDADCLFEDVATRTDLQRVLRRALDHELAKKDPSDVAVAFVLLGTQCLPSTMGVELAERLRPLAGCKLTASDVARLVRAVARGLWTIDEGAARMLAERAENLSLLRDWLEAASRTAVLRGAHTLTSADVTEAESWMVNELREGRAASLELRLVHSLAGRCPGSAELRAARLAVAAAWAKVRVGGAPSEAELVEAVVAQLTEWAEEACGDRLQRLRFEPEGVAIHARALREQGLLDQLEFCSELRQAHLLRVASRPPLDDEWFRSGLRAVGEQQVVPPALLEPIALGDSAKVFRFTADGERLAYREVLRAPGLSSAEFHARLGALRAVQHASRARAPGSEFVFDLCAVGIRFDDSDVAVQIYRWIDGEDLGSRVGGLSAAAVTQIGRCLARALDWLHGLGVLGFELRPEHVILEARHAHPVIIDLGLARLDASGVQSRSPLPPRSGWSRGADTGALGTLLASLLAPSAANGELSGILARMVDVDPDARPSAAELVTQLDAIQARILLESASRASFRREVLDVARSDFRFAYYRDVVQKFGPSFEASWLGLYPTPLQRATRAADFLNQLLEAWSSEHFGPSARLSLGSVKRKNHATGDRLVVPEVAFLHLLRTYRSHGGRGTLAEQVKARYGRMDLAELRALTLHGAGLIAQEMRLSSLPNVVAAFFETGAHGRD